MKFGLVQVDKPRGEEKLVQLSKMLLRVMCEQEQRVGNIDSTDWQPGQHLPGSTYLVPEEILRTFRLYCGDIQELPHVWSLIINFNAFVSQTAANRKLPKTLTIKALRPAAVWLECGVPLLTRKLCRRPTDWLRCVSNEIENDKEVKSKRVALHDVPDQPAFTAGLTIASTKGIDGWARVQLKPKQERGESERGESEDAVILLQTKGKQMRNVQFWGGDDRTLSPEVIQSFVQSLMLSGYKAVDQHVLAILEKYQNNEVPPKMLVRACVRACVRAFWFCEIVVRLNARFVHTV